jgi:hypothetical protein
MSAHRIVAPAVLVCFGVPLAVPAQNLPDTVRTRPLCWTARSAPRCRVVLLTNFGVYADLVQAGGTSSARPVADVGLMVNVSRRDAVGVTLFVGSTAEGYLGAGPALRYRRWMSSGSSLDLAVGFRTAVRGSDQGAITGLVKLNVGPYFGVALRPEILRSDPPAACGIYGVGCKAEQRLRLSAGFEFGSWTGVAVPVVGGLIGLVVAIANPPHIM